MRRFPKWLLAIPALVLALVVGGPFVYINFIKEDAPERLAFTEAAAAPESSTTTTSGDSPAETTATTAVSAGQAGVDGQWTVVPGTSTKTEAGYRVEEVIAGQNAEAAGRTSKATGTMEIVGTTVKSASVVVDLTSVTSDESRRDNQFRGRIMNVATFPTATFEITQPIDLETLPADGTTITVPAAGNLTMHGTTKAVTVDLEARRNGANIEVLGTIPGLFADYGIPHPSSNFVKTEDRGEIEFLVVFAQV
jgi:polyisoprenoid-binding protein YceI